MAIVIGKVAGTIFSSADYHVIKITVAKGKHEILTYRGDSPPKAMKTIEFSFYGQWQTHAKYGRQLVVERYERFQGKRVRPMNALEAVLRSSTD